MKPIFTLTHFTPAEAERITGVTTTLQRDWRRRAFIPVMDGHARFDLFQLAEMITLNALANRGIGPSLSKQVSEICAKAIVYSALAWSNAWDGDAHSDLAWRKIQPHIKKWDGKSEYLITQLWQSLKIPLAFPAPCFIWWADGTHCFSYSYDFAISNMLSDDPRTAGPVIILNLNSLGTVMLDRAGRELAHVEFCDPVSGEQIDK